MEKQPKLQIVGILHGDMVRRKKPDPEIYLKAQHSYGISPQERIAFEDSAHGLNSAENAGMYGVAMPNEFTLNHNFERADLILNSLNEMDDEKITTLSIISKPRAVDVKQLLPGTSNLQLVLFSHSTPSSLLNNRHKTPVSFYFLFIPTIMNFQP